MRVSMTFSNRVRKHPRITAFSNKQRDLTTLAVSDHLLVCESVWGRVAKFLEKEKLDPEVLGTVLDGQPPAAGSEDVRIVRIKLPAGRDVFDTIRIARKELNLAKDESGKVSPNHVLIPASFSHGCPWGPPLPVGGSPALEPMSGPSAAVTIIDSGYQWDAGTMGANPLDAYAPFGGNVTLAEFLGPAGWSPGTPDVLDADGNGRLDALAGHANFIAGVIAQNFTGAQISIRNHNGGFDPASDDFPTEASVARSLCLSGAADVIDLGFAFVTFDGGISCAWELAMNQIGTGPIVVIPAGNNNSNLKRYPAALSADYPNVVSVASVDGMSQTGTPRKSSFSNYGPWVTASARGSKVVSTFLRVDMRVEDDPTWFVARARDFANGWAQWNGTSFATPKVVAAIAREVAAGNPTDVALQAVIGKGILDPAGNLGTVLDL
jgi:thermitase